MTEQQLQELFESIYPTVDRVMPNDFIKDEDGTYLKNHVRSDYNLFCAAWKASREELIITLPHKVFEDDDFYTGYNYAIDYCVEWIEGAGLKVAYD